MSELTGINLAMQTPMLPDGRIDYDCCNLICQTSALNQEEVCENYY